MGMKHLINDENVCELKNIFSLLVSKEENTRRVFVLGFTEGRTTPLRSKPPTLYEQHRGFLLRPTRIRTMKEL